MSEFLEIINKLAEKSMLNGDDDFAVRLVHASDLLEKCKYCREADAINGKEACGKCSKKTACSLSGCNNKTPFGEMVKYANKSFCCSDCVKKFKESMKPKTALDALKNKYIKTSGFLDDESVRFKGQDAITNNSGKDKVIIETLRGEFIAYLDEHQELGVARGDSPGKAYNNLMNMIGEKDTPAEHIESDHGSFASSNLKQMIKKYAQEFVDSENLSMDDEYKDMASKIPPHYKIVIEKDKYNEYPTPFFAYVDDQEELFGVALGNSPDDVWRQMVEKVYDHLYYEVDPQGIKEKESRNLSSTNENSSFASNKLKQMIKKYAQGYMSDDQMFSMDEADSYPFNSEVEGFDASTSNGDNPYSPGSIEYKAWQSGYEEGLKSQNQSIPDFKGDF